MKKFVDDVRIAAQGPSPVPSVTLATMLASGLSTNAPATQVCDLSKRRKKTPVPQLIAGMSLAGKLVLGSALAAAAATGVGAAGALPDPAQNVVAGVVNAATPFTFPTVANHHATVGKTTSTKAHDTTHGADGHPTGDPATPQSPDVPDANDHPDTTTPHTNAGVGIGGTVSGDARSGGVDGATVSGTAHNIAPPPNSGHAPSSTTPPNSGHAPSSTTPATTSPTTTPGGSDHKPSSTTVPTGHKPDGTP